MQQLRRPIGSNHVQVRPDPHEHELDARFRQAVHMIVVGIYPTIKKEDVLAALAYAADAIGHEEMILDWPPIRRRSQLKDHKEP